jgi:hypothetical protein
VPGAGAAAAPPRSLEALFAHVKATPRDLDRHAERVRGLASQAKHIVAFVKRKEWDVLLAAGRPDVLLVHQAEQTP